MPEPREAVGSIGEAGEKLVPIMWLPLPPFSAPYHHIDLAATTPGADQPLAPIKNRGVGAPV